MHEGGRIAAIYTREDDAPRPRRAGVYARISRDDAGEGLGVGRQEEDCRREAGRRGWEVAGVYEDNDLSGSGRVRRPAYEDLVGAIRAGEINVVIAWDLDRLHRGLSEFVEFYEACEQAGVTIAWMGGEADFKTGRGLLEMELRASFAREELRKIKQRIKRKHLELLVNGKSAGGPRPYGYDRVEGTKGWTVVREDEAALIREAARRVLDGESLGAICRDWNSHGIKPQKIDAWQAGTLRNILVSARISGRRELKLQPDGRSLPIGQIRAKANWPAIIPSEESDRLRNIFSAHLRVGRPPASLLAGIAICGAPTSPGEICGHPLRYSNHPYRSLTCDIAPGKGGCGRIRVMAEPVEAMVTEAVLRRIEKGDISQHMKGDDGSRLIDELKAIDDQLTAWGMAVGEGRLLQADWEGLRAGSVKRRKEIEQELATIQQNYDLEGLPNPLRPAWYGDGQPELSMPRKRAVIKRYVRAVVIKPSARRGPRFDEDRVSILGRA